MDNLVTPEFLEQENARLQEELTDALKINEELTNEIQRLSVAQPAKSAVVKPIDAAAHSFTNSGKKYGFNYPKLNRKGQLLTPVEVCASTELQDALIAEKSSFIKEL